MLTLHAKLENVSLCHYSAQVLNHLHNTCLHIRGFTSTFYATWAQGYCYFILFANGHYCSNRQLYFHTILWQNNPPSLTVICLTKHVHLVCYRIVGNLYIFQVNVFLLCFDMLCSFDKSFMVSEHFNLKENKLLCIDTFCVIEINYLLFVCSVY